MKLIVAQYLFIFGTFICFRRISANAVKFPRRDKVPVEAYKMVHRIGTPLTVGQCIKTKDSKGTPGDCNNVPRATGEVVFRASSLHSGKLNRVEKSTEYESVTEGGVGVGISLCGLFSASISGRVRKELKTKSRSITMLAILDTNFGHDSLTKMRYNNGQNVPNNHLSKYFVSDIEYGSRDILKATMNFRSRASKTLVEVTVKVKILFISFSKTIRHVKETSTSDFTLEVRHINNRGKNEFTKLYDKNNMEAGLRKLEELEKKFEELPNEVKKVYKNPATRSQLAMNYYVLPYSVLKVTSPPVGVVVLKNAVSIYLQKRLLRIFEELMDVDESLKQLANVTSRTRTDAKCPQKRTELEALRKNVNETVIARKKKLQGVLDEFYRLENAHIKSESMKMIEEFGRRETARNYRVLLAKHCPDVLEVLDY